MELPQADYFLEFRSGHYDVGPGYCHTCRANHSITTDKLCNGYPRYYLETTQDRPQLSIMRDIESLLSKIFPDELVRLIAALAADTHPKCPRCVGLPDVRPYMTRQSHSRVVFNAINFLRYPDRWAHHYRGVSTKWRTPSQMTLMTDVMHHRHFLRYCELFLD